MGRSLKSDLEWIIKTKSDLSTADSNVKIVLEKLIVEKALEGWPYAIQRAFELEEEQERSGNTIIALTRALQEKQKNVSRMKTILLMLLIELEAIKEFIEEESGEKAYWIISDIEEALSKYKKILDDIDKRGVEDDGN